MGLATEHVSSLVMQRQNVTSKAQRLPNLPVTVVSLVTADVIAAKEELLLRAERRHNATLVVK